MIPSVPPAAVTPKASLAAYPLRIISGTATEPIVAAVTGLDPHTAANPAQEKIVPIGNAPGMNLSQIWAAVKRSRPIRVAPSASPMSMNKGTIRRTKLDACAKSNTPNWLSAPVPMKTTATSAPDNAVATATGVPVAKG